MLNRDNINYSIIKTSMITEKQKSDFLEVFNHVFHEDKGLDWFKWKYQDNIYGDSVIVIAYDKAMPIGIRSFWRNDINGRESYQPCDTALYIEYRKIGIFPEMSKLALEQTREGYIYNFPNENSKGGNIKMGWEKYNTWFLSFCMFKNEMLQETSFIQDDYLKWRFLNKPNQNYYYTKYKNEYFLLYKRSNKMYYVLGRFNSEYKDRLKLAKGGFFFIYKNVQTLTYNLLKSKSTIYVFNKDDKKVTFSIPMNKADFFS